MKYVIVFYVFILSLASFEAKAGNNDIWGNSDAGDSGGIWGNGGFGSDVFSKPTGNGELPEDNTSDNLMNGDEEPVSVGNGTFILFSCLLSYTVYLLLSGEKRKLK